MKNAIALLVGAVAAGAGFGAASHYMGDDGQASVEAVAPSIDLAAELQSLRDANLALRERVRVLEQAPLDDPREPLDSSYAEFEKEVREFMAGVDSGRTVQPVLIADVEDALSSIRREEKQASQAVREEKRAQWEEQRITKMSDMLGLSATQTDEVRTLFTERAARNTEMVRVWEETGDREVAGQMKLDNATLHREGLERVLTPAQLETLAASRIDDK